MNITVFGGAGFLGSHVCDSLSCAGHAVTVADIVPSPWLRSDQRGIIADVTDADAVARAVEHADAVCNFAGIAGIEDADAAPVESARVNILGTVQTLEACRRAGVRRYLLASSLYTHGRAGGCYRVSKQACELYAEQYRQRWRLPCTVVRYGSLYGPRADGRNAIRRLVDEALRGGPLTLSGSPDSCREYVHVTDAALATVRLLEEEQAHDCVIVSGSVPVRAADLVRMLAEMLGRPLEASYAAASPDGHYQQTPCAFMPGMGRKFTPQFSVDFGLGLLHVMEEACREHLPQLNQQEGC